MDETRDQRMERLAEEYAAVRAAAHLKGEEYLKVNAEFLAIIISGAVYRGIAIGLEEGRAIYREVAA